MMGRLKRPDVVTAWENKGGRQFISIVEVYNGARPQYILQETKDLLNALTQSSELSERVGVKKIPRILITCTTTRRLEKAKARILKRYVF